MAQSLVVTASEANRYFARLLRAVAEGKRVTITSHGKPVAQIGPVDNREDDRLKMKEALAQMETRWAATEPRVIGPWTREELYERD